MNSFYWLRRPASGPPPPSHWSYSALQSWRHCPLQWSLFKSSYPDLPEGSYPSPVSPAAFQGQIIHSVLETYTKFLREHKDTNQAQEPFPIRRIVRQKCDELLQQQAQNPRADTNQIKAGISLNLYINLFKRVLRSRIPLPSPSSSSLQGKPLCSSSVKNGAEVWIEVDDPPLLGCLDIVSDGEILDLKTGEPRQSDQEQLHFYALLYWLREKRLPKSLKLYYTQTSEYVETQVPSEPEIRNQCENLRHEIASMNHALRDNSVKAEPGKEKCERCPVRQLCGTYWTSHETVSLRASSLSDLSISDQEEAQWRDIHLDSLPGSWKPGSSCIGRAHSPGIGEIHVDISQARCPDAGDDIPSSAIALKARIKRQENKWHLSVGKFTEVFWISGVPSS